MPIYEYACDACGATIEVLQRVADEPLRVHESCGGGLRRLVSAPRTQVRDEGGMRGSLPDSTRRAHENRRIAADAKAQTPRRTMSLPGPGGIAPASEDE